MAAFRSAEAYNYPSFTRDVVLPMLDFAGSPGLGVPVPDFPLWELDGARTTLAALWQAHPYTVIEFGSFT